MAEKKQRRKASKSLPVPPLADCLEPDGQTCRIPIAGGHFALVDAEDYQRVAAHRWHLGGSDCAYASTTIKGRTTYLHRLVMDAGPGEFVDHREGDQLDCRKARLRKATRGQNTANRGFTKSATGFRGVDRRKRGAKPFRAYLWKDGQPIRGGWKATAVSAASNFDTLARDAWGEFGSFNFPQPGERHCQPAGAALEARRHAGGRDNG